MNANNTDVLVIDDSATIRKLVEMSMRGTQFRVHFANSGADGLEQARALRPGVILLDCVLPDSSGLDVCRQLADDDRTRSIPVLLITARHERARDEFRQFGSVVDFVGKPFTGSDLLARVGRAVGLSAPAPASPPRRFTRDQQERAAKILYARMRDGFALIPSHMSRLGGSPPAPYFAKRLLTPEVMEKLLDELTELYEEVLAAPPARGAASVDPDGVTVSATAVLDRAPGFSDRVRAVNLGSTSRRVLTLIDGKHTLADIARRIDLDDRSACAIAQELVNAGLLLDKGAAPPAPPRPVVIVEPDVQGFQRPLASLLESRPERRPLVAIDDVDEVVAAVHRVKPCLVVVNASQRKPSVEGAARLLRADTALADVALVAVLDTHDRSNAEELYSAGFDAVLSKPIIFGDLEKYIAPAAAR